MYLLAVFILNIYIHTYILNIYTSWTRRKIREEKTINYNLEVEGGSDSCCQILIDILGTEHLCCVCGSVAQSCPTLCDPSDCNPPGSSVHGHSPGRNTGAGCHSLLQGIFLTQGSNPVSRTAGRVFTNRAAIIFETRPNDSRLSVADLWGSLGSTQTSWFNTTPGKEFSYQHLVFGTWFFLTVQLPPII